MSLSISVHNTSVRYVIKILSLLKLKTNLYEFRLFIHDVNFLL